MAALLYIIICFLTGLAVWKLSGTHTGSLFKAIAGPDADPDKLPPEWTFDIPFAFITGTTLVTTSHYFLSYAAHFAVKGRGINPLLISNTAVLILFIVVSFLLLRKYANHPIKPLMISHKAFSSISGYFAGSPKFYAFTTWGFAMFAIYLIFYSFVVKGQILHSGYTVFSDFAPHTAVISSFAYGDNFPTEYPHFAGDGIQFHFFFYYLCANLLYLGARFDFAMNVPTIIGILSFTTLLGSLGVLLTKRKTVFLLAPFMLFFRSSFAIFDYLKELTSKPGSNLVSIIKDIFNTNKFIGTTVHDDWGLWAMNVYANQRHLLWGASMLLVVIFIMYPNIKGPFSLKSWLIDDYRKYIPVLALTAVFPYWHGSVLISMLCMLLVMAFFAKERLAYLAVAVIGTVSSFLFSALFSGGAGEVVTPAFLWGFISPDKSFPGVSAYLFKVTGVALIFILIYPFIRFTVVSRDKLIFFAASFSLIAFAFTVSLTSDVTVNHKYIILGVALLNIFVADMYLMLWAKVRKVSKDSPALSFIAAVLAVFIGFSLFATGFIEFIGYRNKNINSVKIDLQAPLIEWLRESTDPDDVFLTAPYHMNTFFFSGRKIFYGWPYYTMTTGHDTTTRLAEAKELFSGCGGDAELLRSKAKSHSLKYAVIDSTLLNDEGYQVDTAFFASNCTEVARFPENGDMIIYKLYD